MVLDNRPVDPGGHLYDVCKMGEECEAEKDDSNNGLPSRRIVGSPKTEDRRLTPKAVKHSPFGEIIFGLPSSDLRL